MKRYINFQLIRWRRCNMQTVYTYSVFIATRNVICFAMLLAGKLYQFTRAIAVAFQRAHIENTSVSSDRKESKTQPKQTTTVYTAWTARHFRSARTSLHVLFCSCSAKNVNATLCSTSLSSAAMLTGKRRNRKRLQANAVYRRWLWARACKNLAARFLSWPASLLKWSGSTFPIG